MPAPKRPEHVFVLMLENRAFDHMLGFSGLTGIDAASGAHTTLDGLTGSESNTLDGVRYPVARGADWALDSDPGHEFPNVLDQLCGGGVRYGPPYPKIDSSGFVDSFVHTGGQVHPGEIMKCFDTARQLPVLQALALEFAVCDHWFSAIPGPTWPNRMFAHAASSGGLDHSPSTAEILEWETISGFSFPHGTIFNALNARGKKYRLYSGDDTPMVAALKGIELWDVHRIDTLISDLQKNPFPYNYVFIEPSYNVIDHYRHSTSQHPLADVRDGEAFIKRVYEAIRNSPAWDRSLLIITWDEHGGFYDHVAPPRAVAPGDTRPGSKYNQYGFTFEQYGVRVPAIVVSPLVPGNTIDHRYYGHSSIPATVEAIFGLAPMTERDRRARNLLSLLSLGDPAEREKPRLTMPEASVSPAILKAVRSQAEGWLASDPPAVARPDDSINDGTLPSIVHSALRQHLQMVPGDKQKILERVAGLQTRRDAAQYVGDVQAKLRAHKA